MKLRLKPVTLAVAQLVVAGAFSAAVVPAQAQTNTGVVGRVDVTGTNIRRVDAETPSEVQVITSQQMIESGYTSVSEVLRNLTANSNGTLTTGFGRAFAGGASGVSLRGLTVGSTLILLDGYRMAGYPRTDDAQRQFVDLSSIPFVAVDRIEVLLDGASAIYGSDAIAGVINIILKKDFKGTYANASIGTTTKGGGTTVDAQLMQGFGDVSAGLGGYLALEYRSQDAIYLSQRDSERWAVNGGDYTPWGGNDLRPGARSVSVPNPVILGAPYLQTTTGSTALPQNNAFLTDTCSFAARNANQCTYKNTWSQIQPRQQDVNIIGSVSSRLSSEWLLNVTASYFGKQAAQISAPGTVNFASFAGFLTGGPNQAPKVGVNPIPNFTVPANYPGNPFGAPANVRATFPVDGTNRSQQEDVGTSRLVAQLTGTGWGWDWTGAAGYTNVTEYITYKGFSAPANLYAALNNPTNPYKLTGGNSQDQENFVHPTVNINNWNTLSFAQVSGSRDLMQLQGGPLSLAIGAGDVYRNLSAPNSGAGQDGTVGVNSLTTYAVGSQNNTFVYAELAAPVLKNLEIDAAVRYDYYNTPNNSTWNPKVGVKWTPIQQLALRGTAGTGFRAPYITEAGNAGSTFNFNSIRDTLNCPVPGTPNSPQNVQGTCSFNPAYLQSSNQNLQPEKSDQFTAGLILEPIKGWSTTFDYYYIKLKNQIIPSSSSPDYNPQDNLVRNPVPTLVTFGDGRTGLSTAPLISYVKAPFINAQSVTTDGFDLNSGYTWKLPDSSTLLTSVMWSHILSYDLTSGGIKSKLAGTHGPTAVGGDTGTPKDRAQATIQWMKGPWTATFNVNYIGRFNVLDPSSGSNDCQTALAVNNNAAQRWANTGVAPDYCNVASFTYTNMYLAYQYNKNWTFNFTVQNLFNARPPFDFETYGSSAGQTSNAVNAGLPYNPALHQIGAVGPFISVGFIYNFN